MILPVVKLGSLALKTLCKPIASKLKKEAGLHPKFRQFIINIAQVLELLHPPFVFLILLMLILVVDLWILANQFDFLGLILY